MSPKDADGIANSEDPDQGLHCLPRPGCPKTCDHYGKCTLKCSITSFWKLTSYDLISKAIDSMSFNTSLIRRFKPIFMGHK